MNDAPQNGRLTQGEIARRALKTLAERKQIPTPDLFAEVYLEMAGQRAGSAVSVVKELLRDLIRSSRLSTTEATALMELAAKHDWYAVREQVDRALARRPGALATNWPQSAAMLLKQIDSLHSNWTRGRKLEAVLRVLDNATAEPDTALERIQRLMESWGPVMATLPRPDVSDEGPVSSFRSTQPATNLALNTAIQNGQQAVNRAPLKERYGDDSEYQAKLASAQAAAEAWKQVALRSLTVLEGSCGTNTSAQIKLREYLRQNLQSTEFDKLVPRFTDVVAALDRQISEEQRVKTGLQRLLALLCDNMKSLTPEEAWLAGQLEPIRALLAGPIESSVLADAENRLSQVLSQQAGARRSLQEAKVALKEMLATLIERIGSMGTSTGRFYDQVGAHAAELEKATDFETLSRVIRGLLADTQVVRADIQASREELMAARRKVESYEQRVRQLEKELTQVSTLVQKDPLTHAMNRRGLEEAFKLETARAQRYGTDLSIAMLDIDNFKMLNDSLGHLAGDRALVHLMTVLQAVLRPTDVIARVGGEEFAVLFSATQLDEAQAATDRARTELAKRAFTHDGQAHLLSFSAGVTGWHQGETLEDLMRRADETMYRAKREGKNRVLRSS